MRKQHVLLNVIWGDNIVYMSAYGLSWSIMCNCVKSTGKWKTGDQRWGAWHSLHVNMHLCTCHVKVKDNICHFTLFALPEQFIRSAPYARNQNWTPCVKLLHTLIKWCLKFLPNTFVGRGSHFFFYTFHFQKTFTKRVLKSSSTF